MADDLSWIDHPANLRANAALLRAIAEQSLLHADEIERLRGMLDNVMSARRHRGGPDIVERLRRINGWTNEPDASPLEAADEIERLKTEIAEWQKVADASTPEAFRLQMKADGERDD
jgi:hypothetical protein